jgi:tetratricopeptide (TPR) repeat protein
MNRSVVGSLLLLAASAASAAAQSSPPRPPLGAQADTNSAYAYFQHGTSRMKASPREAAAAFYWASRLEPEWADPLYARRAALLLSNPSRLEMYMEGNRRVLESPEIRGIDSLQLRAVGKNPFLYRRYDRNMLDMYVERWAARVQQRSGPNARTQGELQYMMENYLRSAGPEMRAWLAYGYGNFPSALNHYGDALRRTPDKSPIHASRAHLHFLMHNYADALDEMTKALETSRPPDRRRLVRVYETKAVYQHSRGFILEMMRDWAEAREAYGRALEEDMSFGPAHHRLAVVSLAQGDTAGALASFAMATQINEKDGSLRFAYGTTLLAAGQFTEAVEQLQRASELEPYFALPYFELARALEGAGRPADALETYRAFVARASATEERRGQARQRIVQLERSAEATGGGR